MERIKLDLVPGKKMPSLHASQFDDGREHGIDLFENGVAYKLDGTETLTINERKGDNCICSLDIENTFTGSNHIVFASTEQMCAVWGNNICELVIKRGSVTLGTLNFILEIEPSPTEGGIESESEISNLERQITEITEEVIGDDYYTAEETDEAIATAIEGKADKTYVDEQANLKMDKGNPTGTGRIAVGQNVVASGASSQAFGVSSTASGNISHAEGVLTIASGLFSHAEGQNTTASGETSHAEGYQTIASGRYQHVSGKYNVVDNNNTYAEIIGNGTGSNRSNARTLDWQGNETLAGDLIFNRNKSLTSEISRLDRRIDNLPAPMIFKGTLGTGGTIQTLPAASASNEGYTYKVITDGTYAGQTAKVGDVFTSNGSAWVLIPSGDEDNDTWRNIKVNGVEKLGNGISSGAVDFVGSDNIEVEFDSNGNKVGVKTKNIYTQAQVDAIVSDAIYNVLPDDTASGSVANFNTSLELPLKSLEVDVSATQEAGTPTPQSPKAISGVSAVNVVNQNDKASFFRGLLLGTYGFVCLGDLDWNYSTEGPRFFTTSPLSDIALYSNFNNCIAKGYNTILSSIPFSQMQDLDLKRNGSTGVINIKDTSFGANTNAFKTAMQSVYLIYELAEPITPTITLEQFNALLTAFDINGSTTLINLGGTYYGGHFTQDKDGHRQFEVDRKLKTVDGSTGVTVASSSYIKSDACDGYINDDEIQPRASAEYQPDLLCNRLTQAKSNIWSNVGHADEFCINNRSIHFNISNASLGIVDYTQETTETAKAKIDAFLQNNPVVVVIPITPYVIDLPDGEPIVTFNGTNNIYADTGDTSVVFKCSVNDYVSAHSGGNLLGMGGVYLGGAKSGGSEEETDNTEDTEKTKLDETKVEIKTIGDTKKLGGE